MPHETPAEVEINTDVETEIEERPIHASRAVASALRRALNSARNRQNKASAQVAQIEKVLSELGV